MAETPVARRTNVEFPLAILRWLFFAALFGIVYLYSPASRESARFSSLLVLAIAYNLVVTALALFKIFTKIMPAVTVGMDLLFIAALVSISGRNESPLLLFMLVPVVSAALRFHGRGALITALAVALLWMYMLWRAPQPPILENVLPVAIRLLLLLSLALLAALLSYSEKARARERERSANEQFRVASEQVKAIYELTGNLSATLNYERVIESILDIGLLGLHEIGEQNGHPGGAVFLFKDINGERQLYIAAFRNLNEEESRMTFPADGGALAHALTAVEPAVIGKPGDDEELGGLVSWRRYQAAVALPLRAGFELYGTTVFCSERRNAYRDQQLAFLGTLCNQATIALQNAQLYKQVAEEKDRIISGEEDVRHWLARELHDGPTQTISALAMRLNYARLLMEKDPKKAGEELAELEKMARRATKEIRTTLFKLRPLVLESQGLPGALEQYATRLKENGGTPLMLDIEQPMERLEPTVEGTIFAIIEEAVNNAQKYAEAQQISVRVVRFGETLVVTVRDSGKGFDLKAVEASYDQRGSLGLVNMRERAELIGGNLEIDSKPGRGTTVTLAVPMKRAA